MLKLFLVLTSLLVAASGGYVQEFAGYLQAGNLNENLSPNCTRELLKYSKDLQRRELWAFKMFDANSKIQSGLLLGNTRNYGGYTECLSVRSGRENDGIKGKYCLGTLGFPKNFLNQTGELALIDLGSTLWAACVPQACSASEISPILNGFIRESLMENVTLKFTDKMCQVEGEEWKFTVLALVVSCLLSGLVVVAVVATVYDVHSQVNCREPTCLSLLAFSIYTNGKKLFTIRQRNPDHLGCLDGIRAITIMWIVIYHTYILHNFGALFNELDRIHWLNSWHSMYMSNGGVAVDTFFLIGGSVMTYTFMKARSKKVPFSLIRYYLHRYIRLTPTLGMVVLISASLLPYVGSGPEYIYVRDNFQNACREYWWSTILYVQNYVNPLRLCVGQTWYLDVDVQLYLISPVLLFSLLKWPSYAVAGITVGIFIGMAIPFYVGWMYTIQALQASSLYGDSTIYTVKYYIRTHTRFAPWLIGILLGHCIWRQKQTKTKLNLNKCASLMLWLLSLSVLLVCLFGGHQTLRGPEYKKWGNAFCLALVRPAWSVAVCWVIFACLFGHGSFINTFLLLPVFQLLERLSYSIYLVHVTLIFVQAYSRKTPDEFGEYILMHRFWGDFMISVMLSVILMLLVEYPAVTLEKVVTDKLRRYKDKKVVPVV